MALTSERPLVGEARALSTAEEWTGLGFGLWMVAGLFLDGWAHDDGRPESFFTPWHAVLYSGFAATVLAAVIAVWRRRASSSSLRAAVPRGHQPTLVALVAFGVGAVGDLLWHEGFGIEVGIEALLSPTHLVLFASGLVLLSAPIRGAWSRLGGEPDLRAMLPVALNVALLVAVSAFFLAYLSPFVNDASVQGFDPSRLPHDHPSTDVEELQQLLGVASVLVTTVLLALASHALLRRWDTPVGAVTITLGLASAFLIGIDEFTEWFVIFAGFGAGAVVDYLRGRLGPTLAVAGGVGVFWSSYLALHAVVGDPVEWSAELSGGVVIMASLLAAGIGLVAHLPPRSSYDTP
jgi:hypothetical protein